MKDGILRNLGVRRVSLSGANRTLAGMHGRWSPKPALTCSCSTANPRNGCCELGSGIGKPAINDEARRQLIQLGAMLELVQQNSSTLSVTSTPTNAWHHPALPRIPTSKACPPNREQRGLCQKSSEPRKKMHAWTRMDKIRQHRNIQERNVQASCEAGPTAFSTDIVLLPRWQVKTILGKHRAFDY